MRHACLLLLLLTLPLRAAPAQGTYAITDATVIPMDSERVLEHHTVVVRDGRIVALGPTGRVAVPPQAVRIPARDKYLLPGLAEMHAHIPPPDTAGNLASAEEVLFLYLAGGVTTVRGMLGHPAHLELRERVERGEVLGPRVWTSGPSVNGRSVPTVFAAESAAVASKAAGYDLIKIHPGLARDVFDALDRVADSVGIPFAGHVPTDVGLARALEAGYWSIDHLDGYMQALVADDAAPREGGGPFVAFGPHLAPYVDHAKIPVLASATRAAGVWNVPTQILMENYATDESPEALLAQRPELRYMPPRTVESWLRWKRGVLDQGPGREVRDRFIAVRRRLIKALHDAGADLLLGSDAPQVFNVPGFSIRRELEAIVAAGLSPYAALATGTRNVAAFLGVADEAGTVAVGQRADLILLHGNPLDDVAHVADIAGVMIRGRWLPADEIERRLTEIAGKYAQEGQP